MDTTLNIPSVDLVSTVRTAPKNGAPSSADYNDTMREILVDLGSLSELLNVSVLPVLNQLPEAAAAGLEGRTIYASMDDDKTPLFYSESAQKFFTIADVLQNLHTLITQSNNTLVDVTGRIVALQSKLATTSHNDVINAVQGFTDQVRQVSYAQSGLTRAVESQAAELDKTQTVRKTLEATAAGTSTLDITWPVPFKDNSYTVALAVEGAALTVGFVKMTDGAGITVSVNNPGDAVSLTIHATAKAD
jgi:uncharacterized protein